MPIKVENGDFCPVCKEKNMPPWKSPTETARACQGCNTVEERKIRERGYYWIKVSEIVLVGLWDGTRWILCLLGQSIEFDKYVEVKGKVIQGEWKE
jgi:hypothetical protein